MPGAYPRVAAHRGGGTLAPENTLAAIDTGARFGHTMVEFDAKLSVDNVAFLLHDDTVGRTSNGRGRAARMRYEALAVLDAGAYGMSQSSNYNTRLRPAEVLVQGAKARLIRRRETIEDLLGPERV